jgi:hypothetical protein
MTRMIDFDDLRRSGLPSFGTLENASRFLNTASGSPEVYPSLAVNEKSGAGRSRRRIILEGDEL